MNGGLYGWSAAVLIALSPACDMETIPYDAVDMDGVDSLRIDLEEGVLGVRIYSNGGVGSCGMLLPDPVEIDSLLLELYYGKDRYFESCEYLQVEIAAGGEIRNMYPGDEPAVLRGGGVSFMVECPIEGFRIRWIDYYRN